MLDFTVRPLNESNWPDFARLVEKHNGVWGGCWCIGFHQKPGGDHQALKKERVRDGLAHAALVYDGENAVGWCQFGPTDELPRIKHRKQYEAGLDQLPDWRITCFFTDKDYRGKGVASVALAGALAEIIRMGGGVVESYPEAVEGRKTAPGFIYNASLSIFDRLGFERVRRLGKNHWVVSKRV